MIRRAPLLLLLLALAAAALWGVDLPQKWRSWRFSRAVLAPPSQAPGNSEILLPWDLFARCKPNCADIRLIDDRGQEVPFELSAHRLDFSSHNYYAKVVENSFVRGQYTQVIADVGEDAPHYDRVGIETGKSDFIVWAQVALSDDAKTWRIVEPRAPIARFRSRAVEGTQTIPFQGINSRYIRVRIFEPEAQFPVNGVRVLYQSSQAPERTEIPASFSSSSLSAAGESSWQANLHSASLPVSEVRISSDTQEFYRAVRISGSADGKQWNYVTSGAIYRYRQGGNVRESLQLDFPESWGDTFLRAEVVNGDDQPLTNVRIALFGIPRTLLFRQEAGHTYRILYGDAKASAPQYDVRYYLAAGQAKGIDHFLPLGQEQLTSNYADPRPFTERHPILLWLALAIAVLLLGYTALRTLRSPVPPAA
jgi:Protein of unknown function (DUF3999)